MLVTCFNAKYPKYENTTARLTSIDELKILYEPEPELKKSVQQNEDSIITESLTRR